MGLLISACGVLALFMLRDIFILGSKQELVSRKLAVYLVLTSAYLLCAIRIASSFPEGRSAVLLRSPWIWGMTLMVHAGLWWVSARLKRVSDGSDWMWLIAVVPAPMLILSIIAVTHRLSVMMNGWNLFTSGVIIWSGWVVSVLSGVLAFRTVYREWEDRDCVGNVAEIASWTGIGILPFAGIVQWLQVLIGQD
jgi:hypothetical protein